MFERTDLRRLLVTRHDAAAQGLEGISKVRSIGKDLSFTKCANVWTTVAVHTRSATGYPICQDPGCSVRSSLARAGGW